MAEPFISEIRIFSFNYAPKGWAKCNGQILPIAQNQALFALLGTTYGGDGRTTFALPNLQGRTPMHIGTHFQQGQAGGAPDHTLTVQEMPAHSHLAKASSNAPSVNTPSNNFWPSNTGYTPYAATANETMNVAAIANGGGGQPHDNMAPYLAVNICIALVGIFPSRN
jgi:microcystin-dependent protein